MKDYWINKFKSEVIPSLVELYKPEKILLFGSRVRGNATAQSDIDVIIVSNFFENIPFMERMSMLLKKIEFDKHVDFICYSPDEFESIKDKSSIIINALNNGTVFYELGENNE